jgi:inner membrane protein
MDSLTQAVLGAAVAIAVLPAARAKRAAVYGAVLGTLPDLDALIHFSNPVDSFVYHRSATHSLILLSLFAPMLWWLLRRFDKALQSHSVRWLLAFWLTLITHPLLDWFTNYGTQLFWPIVDTPFALSSVFIIDPIYTLPLAIASVLAWRSRAIVTRVRARRFCMIALVFSQVYLGWTLIAQHWIRQRVMAAESVHTNHLKASDVAVYAAPFTSLLYRVLIKEQGAQSSLDSYRESYVSVFADLRSAPIWRDIPRYGGAADSDWASLEVISQLHALADFQRLARFSQGFYGITLKTDQTLVLSDLRMGSAPSYVFNFELASLRPDGTLQAQATTQLPGERPDLRSVGWLFRRIYTPAEALPPKY